MQRQGVYSLVFRFVGAGRGNTAPAKAPTAEEFADFVRDVDAIMKAHNQAPYYVYDNPYIHVGKAAQQYMQDKGLDKAERFKIPPYSPEFNKVIEHAHARLEGEVQVGLTLNPKAWGFQGVSKIITQAFYKVNDPAVIRKDVLSLPNTYLAVKKAKGGTLRESCGEAQHALSLIQLVSVAWAQNLD
jgi:hypothetical protein